MMQENSSSTAVRMFPDYAYTVLWLDGPVDYEGTSLSPGLICELELWEQFYYESLDADSNWKSAEDARAFTKTGIDLAGQVANELGEEFSVEFVSYETAAPTYTVHSHRPADNEDAAATFSTIVAEMEAEQECVARLVAESGPNAEWTAFAPLSGMTFTPGKHVPRPEVGD